MAVRFDANAVFIRKRYEMAPETARNWNLATAADFVPRSIVTSPERWTSMRYGCFNTVGVAVGTPVLVGILVGCAVSVGANRGAEEARVYSWTA
jgi:hypothetical protein